MDQSCKRGNCKGFEYYCEHSSHSPVYFCDCKKVRSEHMGHSITVVDLEYAFECIHEIKREQLDRKKEAVVRAEDEIQKILDKFNKYNQKLKRAILDCEKTEKGLLSPEKKFDTFKRYLKSFEAKEIQKNIRKFLDPDKKKPFPSKKVEELSSKDKSIEKVQRKNEEVKKNVKKLLDPNSKEKPLHHNKAEELFPRDEVMQKVPTKTKNLEVCKKLIQFLKYPDLYDSLEVKLQGEQWDSSLVDVSTESELNMLVCFLPGSRVTALSLQRSRLGLQGGIRIADVLPNCQLTSLNLEETKLGVKVAKLIAEFLPGSKLTFLNLAKNNIGLKGGVSIANALPKSRLTTLDLGSNKVGEKTAIAIGNALPKSKLTTLKLRNNKIEHEGGESIANALPRSQLIDLDLSCNIIGRNALIEIGRNLPYSQLISLGIDLNLNSDSPNSILEFHVSLSLSSDSISSIELDELFEAKNYSLSGLNSYGNPGTKDLRGFNAIKNALPDSQLATLNLESNRIEELASVEIANFLPHTRLTTLNLRYNSIKDRGAEAIASVLPRTRLVSLNLGYNEIEDEGAIAIARVLPKTKLVSLNLAGNTIRHQGAEAIASFLPRTKLVSLNLEYSGIPSAEAITIALSDSKLTALDLSRNKIAYYAENKIKRAKPDLNVLFH